MGHELRDYQEEAVQALFESLCRSPDACPLVVMPTGSGKSHVIAEFVRRALEAHPGTTVLIATHVKELVKQNFDKLLRAWPGAPAGIHSAGLGARDLESPIIFAGVQSIYRNAKKLGVNSILLVDEAHLIPREGTGMYRSLIDTLRKANPELRLVGFTATEYRTDSGLLYTGKGALFNEVCYRADVTRLVDAGWLSDVCSKGSDASIDLSKVHIRRGEYVEAEQERAALEILDVSVSEIMAYSERCKKWLVFCCSIKHAEATHDLLRSRGISTVLVTSDTSKEDRDMAVSWFRTVDRGCLVNMNVFTTGFDVPDVDLVVLLRATCSPVLYVQIVGRGMRVAPGKKECVLLDFGSNVERHGPINNVRLRKKKEEPGLAPYKKCPECKTWVPLAALECKECGHKFPERKPKHDPHPIPGTVIDRGDPLRLWYDVDSVSYRRHQSMDKPKPTVRVVYGCGYNTFSEWVCPEHEGYAGTKAREWWFRRDGVGPGPKTVDEFIQRADAELEWPSSIEVDFKKRWPVVVSYAFERDGQEDGAGVPQGGEGLSW